jgi:HAD superfamily hydrolase (TIGR01459 family)
MATDSTAVLASIAPLADTADAWISDIWGVLHNGVVAFPPAGEACITYRRQGGTVVLVTNAPYSEAVVRKRLDELAIPRTAYDAIVTSGDVSRALLDEHAGEPIFHLGPDRSLSAVAGYEQRLVGEERAGIVMCTGLVDDDHEQPEAYRPMLERLARRGVPLVCANPDIVVERGPRLVPCAGALALIYEELGGRVLYAGKPHAPVYERAFAEIAAARGTLPPKERILAIGDGLRTDIEGARRSGLRSVFIASALHVGEGRTLDAPLLAELFAAISPAPVAAMRTLVW